MAVADPTLDLEHAHFVAGARIVLGIDEVGRGAIAGPVAVGVSVLDAECAPMPLGLRDSKLLSEPKRVALEPVVASWCRHSAVGVASNEEIDRHGIIRALGLAGYRALASLAARGVALSGGFAILDGSHDWLSPALPDGHGIRVATRVKADRDCASVAAASVLAKVHRDTVMIDADGRMPGYGWAGNKGYASAEHYAAVDRLGPSELHRWSWLRQPSLTDAI